MIQLGVVGPRGSGKTSLAKLLSLDADKIEIHEAPGGHDFLGAALVILAQSDLALIVVNAGSGFDTEYIRHWRLTQDLAIPTLIVITHLDSPESDFDETCAILNRVLSQELSPIHLVLHDDLGSPAALIELISLMITQDDSQPTPADGEIVEMVMEQREELIESLAILLDDENSAAKLLGEITPSAPMIERSLIKVTSSAHFTPLVATSVARHLGIARLRELLTTVADDISPTKVKKPTDGELPHLIGKYLTLQCSRRVDQADCEALEHVVAGYPDASLKIVEGSGVLETLSEGRLSQVLATFREATGRELRLSAFSSHYRQTDDAHFVEEIHRFAATLPTEFVDTVDKELSRLKEADLVATDATNGISTRSFTLPASKAATIIDRLKVVSSFSLEISREIIGTIEVKARVQERLGETNR